MNELNEKIKAKEEALSRLVKHLRTNKTDVVAAKSLLDVIDDLEFLYKQKVSIYKDAATDVLAISEMLIILQELKTVGK